MTLPATICHLLYLTLGQGVPLHSALGRRSLLGDNSIESVTTLADDYPTHTSYQHALIHSITHAAR